MYAKTACLNGSRLSHANTHPVHLPVHLPLHLPVQFLQSAFLFTFLQIFDLHACAGQLQITTDQAIEVLGAFQTLLGATPAVSTSQAAMHHALPGRDAVDGGQHVSIQTSPATRSRTLGKISSFDSAQSHARHTAGRPLGPFDSGSTEPPSFLGDTSAGASALNKWQVTQAMPPPPSHAEHALDQQKPLPQLRQASRPSEGSSWPSQAVEAHQRQSSMSEQQLQGIANRQPSQTSWRSASPFDVARRHSYAQEGDPQPSGASELSQEGASRLRPHSSKSIIASPFDAVCKEPSVQERSSPIPAGSHQTSNASVQSQTDTRRPQPDSGQGGVTTRPSATAHPTFAAPATSHVQDKPRQVVASQDSPGAQRISQWADAQMAQSQKNAEGSADFEHSAQSGLAAMSGQDGSMTFEKLIGQSKGTQGGIARSSTSGGSHQPASAQQSRRSSLEVLENLNCPIIQYDQLQIKRKIGDGSIGLVRFGLVTVDVEVQACAAFASRRSQVVPLQQQLKSGQVHKQR